MSGPVPNHRPRRKAVSPVIPRLPLIICVIRFVGTPSSFASSLEPFRKFQRRSALRSGKLLQYPELARDAGVSVDTARRYLEYLRISYQSILLQPYHRNITSTVVKTPKLYWVDMGIFRQLTGFRGEPTGDLYEIFVVGEIYK
jgi:uncharacterized protein